MLTTTTARIRADERGVLGRIWHCAGDFGHRQLERRYWLPEPRGLCLGRGPCTPGTPHA
jgi:hypothetical protein